MCCCPKIFPKIGANDDDHAISSIDKIENIDDFLFDNDYGDDFFSGSTFAEIELENVDFLELFLDRLREEYEYLGISKSDIPDRDNAMFDLIEKKCKSKSDFCFGHK